MVLGLSDLIKSSQSNKGSQMDDKRSNNSSRDLHPEAIDHVIDKLIAVTAFCERADKKIKEISTDLRRARKALREVKSLLKEVNTNAVKRL